MTETVVPYTPEITGPIAEWIELLQHSKTSLKALGCMVYIGNAFGSENCPARLKISEIDCDVSTNDRAISGIDGEIKLVGGFLGTSLRVEIFPSYCTRIPREKWIDSKKCAKYADHLLAVINKFGRSKYKSQERCLLDFDVVGTFCSFFKKTKPGWSYTELSKETNNTVEAFYQFFVEHKNDAFHAIGQVLLNAIASIDFEYYVASHSPLFEATRSQDLDAVIMLISYGADVNCTDENGLTPLHHAIELNFPFIAKTLIVFGADHKLVKIKGKSVQRYCVNQAKLLKRSRKRSRFVNSGMFHVLKVASVPSTSNVKPSRQYERQLLRPTTIPGMKTHLLSLDGGGIRGLVLTTIMDEIEKTIPDFFEKFKFVAGTSTGSILALAMCQGKTIAQCRNIYFKFKDFVFTKGRGINYDENILEEFLQKTYVENGRKMTMHDLGEISDKKIISTSVDQTNAFLEAAHFKSYTLDARFHQTYRDNNPIAETGSQDTLNDAPDCFATDTDEEHKQEDDVEEPTICVKLHQLCEGVGISRAKPREPMPVDRNPKKAEVHAVARCTSAAPSYFHSAEDGKYVDGGVLNNNPSMVLLREFLEWNNTEKERKEQIAQGEQLQLGAVVSIGTGMSKPNANPNDQCPCRPSGRGGCYDISHLVEMVCKLKGEIGKSDGEVVQQSDTLTKSQDGAFFRFQPIFKEEILLDETDNQTLIEMMWDTKVYMRRQTTYIEILKKIIEQKTTEDHSAKKK